jgi:hypothetical protein
MSRTERLEKETERHKEAVSTISLGKPAHMAPAFRSARALLPVIKVSGVLVLMLWALATLAHWAREEAALDTITRISMDDFVMAYRKSYLHSMGRADDGVQALYIVDVRGESAYIDGHIPGALPVPEEGVEGRIRDLIPTTESEVVLYCA